MLRYHLGLLVLLGMYCMVAEHFSDDKSGYDVALAVSFSLWCICEAFMWVFYFFYIM